MKKLLKSAKNIIMIAFIALSWYFINTSVIKTSYDQVLVIEKGVPLGTTLSALDVSGDMFFKIFLKLKDGGKGIKAGYYKLDGKYTIKELVELLEEGRDKLDSFTIPEGTPIDEVLKNLEKSGIGKEVNFRSALKEIEFPYPTPKGNFEGYIYPDTYYFPEGITEKRVMEIILNEFLRHFPEEEYENKAKFYEMLVLASIIEREAQVWSEKRRISSVFHNRIEKGMRLESDATVNYVYGYEKKRLYYKHLEIESPYNTYRNRGLPPGPIANPDAASIHAAFDPENTEYLFFVASEDGSGRHEFTKTYAEHLEYIKRVRDKNRSENGTN